MARNERQVEYKYRPPKMATAGASTLVAPKARPNSIGIAETAATVPAA